MTDTMPTLTLSPDLDAASAVAVAPPEEAPVTAGPELEKLSKEEQEQVHAFSKQIDISNSQLVLQYGAGAQKNIADFSEAALDSVKTKDLGEVGDMITGLVTELKGFDAGEEAKGIRGLFKKTGKSIDTMVAKYGKAEANVDRIASKLEGHQVVLLKDVAVMDQLYEKNLAYYKELTMYILAGKEKLEYERSVTLPALRQKAAETGLAEDAQKANDFDNLCIRFEKKLHDLELTRIISMQMAPQIRLVQSNDSMMTEKIQTIIMNTIPLWKSQMVIALGIEHSQQAMEAGHLVTDMTNELLKHNSEALHQATVDITKESERGIVDIETLTKTNEELIATLTDIQQIQKEGREKRIAAEAELNRIENELKAKLLEVRS